MVSFGLGLQQNMLSRFRALDLFNEIRVFGKNVFSMAVAGVDPDGIYRGEGITLFADDARLHAVIGQNLRGRIGDEVMLDSIDVTRVDNAGVEVAAAATVKPYFLRALPIPDWTIRATARAYPRSSP